ncbi:recombinase family protein [Pseudomonas fluorescens]|uniref:recombinase family protein n=1 Tax=Pseudomonas fluorescens TaxID=294 RepID=UPI0017820966|nr:recombinase family protein [Pseudomonas fluorescens]MBD8192292.1 recombinase family protein [Pseudomonas fluorescens]MBD8226916.1 recombinase family protein [Pseudomonas fluorescens]MBD8784629.1 recombinase family protein [Pseudomonas fluorescens]MBD8817309.1 recombinase family protein [Pseudomonas fluorescens]
MPTGYAYIRYSTRRQGADDKDSVTRQKSSIRAIAARHGVEVPEENFFYENGVSAYTGENSKTGKLKDLIDQIENLSIAPGDFVFVESIDRLSRQRLLQAKDLVYGILKKGVILVTTMDGYIYKLHEDQADIMKQDIMLTVISSRAHEESLTKSNRRKSAWKKAKTEAEETGIVFNKNRLPYGVIFEEKTNTLVIDKKAQEEIEFILENLKREGVTSTIKKANAFAAINWTQARVKDIFDTKYVLGYFMSQTKIDGKMVLDKHIENYYPKIVSASLFLEAKEAMTNRKVKKHQGRVTQNNANIFRHSCFCERCGKSLVFMNNYNSKGSRYFYMTCQQNIENGNCKNRFRYDLAVKLFLDTMQEFDRLNKKSVSLEPIDVTQYANLDEATLKEIEEVNKSLSMISDGSSGAFKLAKKFVELSKSNKVEDTKTRQKLKKLRDRQSDLEISVENLNKSVGTIKSGIIPSSILNRLSKEEVELNEIKEEIEKLAISKNKSKVQELEFTNLDKTIDFLKTEEGRLNIINFLTSNNIRFSFEYISNTLNSTAYVNNERIGQLSTQNDNKSAPLGIYGFDNLGNVFTQ